MITIVLGPPFSGKAEYVDGVKKSGDVVVDYERVSNAVGADPASMATGAVRIVALAARGAAINRILAGVDSDAYITHSNPSQEQINQYESAHAKFRLIDPGKAACIARAKVQERADRFDDAVALIEAWYANPPTVQGAAKAMKLPVVRL